MTIPIGRLSILLLIFSTLLFSCNPKEKSQESNIEGVYESVGYGRIVKIEKDQYFLADVTKYSCIPLMEGEIAEFGEALQFRNDTLSL